MWIEAPSPARIEPARDNRTAFWVVAPLLGVLLSACAQDNTHLERSSLASRVLAEDAIALPPPGGPSVVGVVERRYANAIQQNIALTTNSKVPGQNELVVQLFGNVGRDGGDTPLPDRQIHNADLRREMRAAFPGIVMQPSPIYVQNAYGPFGYATGVSGRDRCLYAWQRIAPDRSGAPFSGHGSAQVRLRLCETGASEQGLLAMMYGYTINASLGGTGWNPYGTPTAADPRLGQIGQPVVPTSTSGGFDTMLDTPSAPAPRRILVPRQAPRSPAPLPQPPAGAPVVPPPPRADSGPIPVVPPPPLRE